MDSTGSALVGCIVFRAEDMGQAAPGRAPRRLLFLRVAIMFVLLEKVFFCNEGLL
jgi:hypothetical protein